MAHRILFVLTSTTRMGDGGEPTGLWLDEFTVPYFAIRDVGHHVDVVSTAGGAVPIDPRSMSGEAAQVPENRRYQSEPELVAMLRSTLSVQQVSFTDYNAIFLPGGHGTMWDLPDNRVLARGISDMFMAGKPVAAVCHGPAGLIGATLPNGRPLVAGRWVTAFTTEEERSVGLQDKIPFLLDEKLAALGARLVKGAPFTPVAVVQENLITGQNPQSAREAAGIVIAALQRHDARAPARRAVG